MTITIKYGETELFKKEFKKLKKRFPSLDEDLRIAKKNAIELFHILNIDNHSVFPISGLGNEKFQIYKIKKIACKALKGRGVKSGIRIIYAYCSEKTTVDFLEIYFKADKENEDKNRVKDFLKD